MDVTEATGGCLCGAVRFAITAPPFEIDYCHCASCRKHTGAPVAAFLDCHAAAFELRAGSITRYESSPGVHRGFCATCGSTMTYETDERPGEIHIHIGAMDEPERFPPHDRPAFADERLPWFAIAGVDDRDAD